MSLRVMFSLFVPSKIQSNGLLFEFAQCNCSGIMSGVQCDRSSQALHRSNRVPGAGLDHTQGIAYVAIIRSQWRKANVLDQRLIPSLTLEMDGTDVVPDHGFVRKYPDETTRAV